MARRKRRSTRSEPIRDYYRSEVKRCRLTDRPKVKKSRVKELKDAIETWFESDEPLLDE